MWFKYFYIYSPYQGRLLQKRKGKNAFVMHYLGLILLYCPLASPLMTRCQIWNETNICALCPELRKIFTFKAKLLLTNPFLSLFPLQSCWHSKVVSVHFKGNLKSEIKHLKSWIFFTLCTLILIHFYDYSIMYSGVGFSSACRLCVRDSERQSSAKEWMTFESQELQQWVSSTLEYLGQPYKNKIDVVWDWSGAQSQRD